MKTPAELSNTICLLCLPARIEPRSNDERNCTVISYGKKVRSPTTDSTFQGMKTSKSANAIDGADTDVKSVAFPKA